MNTITITEVKGQPAYNETYGYWILKVKGYVHEEESIENVELAGMSEEIMQQYKPGDLAQFMR